VILVAQTFGAVSCLDDDRDRDERGNRHDASISGLQALWGLKLMIVGVIPSLQLDLSCCNQT
jgi:hypothetical protein